MAKSSSGSDLLVAAKCDYKAEGEDELDMKKSEHLRVIDSSNNNGTNSHGTRWRVMNAQGQVGLVPSAYLKKLKTGIFSSLRKKFDRKKSKHEAPTWSVGISEAELELAKKSSASHEGLAQASSASSGPATPPSTDTPTPNNGPSTNNAVAAVRSSSSQSDSHNSHLPVSMMPLSGGVGEFSLSAGAEFCITKFPYTANHSDELTLQKGDEICVLQKCSDSWWFGRLMHSPLGSITGPDGEPIEGWFPSTYTETLAQPTHQTVTPIPEEIERKTNDNLATNKDGDPTTNAREASTAPIRLHMCVVRALFSFTRHQPSELSFEVGEVLEIMEKPEDDPEWWLARNRHSEEGLVPINYIALIRTDGTAVPISSSGVANPSLATVLRLSGEELRRSYNMSGLFTEEEWYWGCISRGDSEAMLAEYAQPGAYLVRDSKTHAGGLTITMYTGSRCRNFKLFVSNEGQFHIGQKVFPGMGQLLTYYGQCPIYKSDEETQFLVRAFRHPGAATPSS